MTESIRARGGYFEGYGGAFIPEVLHATFEELKRGLKPRAKIRASGTSTRS